MPPKNSSVNPEDAYRSRIFGRLDHTDSDTPPYLHPLLLEMKRKEKEAAEAAKWRRRANCPVAALPHELLSMIFSYIHDQCTMLRTAMVCRAFNICATPLLYRYPKFRSTFHWAQFNQTLVRPENTRIFGSFVQVVDLSSVDSKVTENHKATPMFPTGSSNSRLTLMVTNAEELVSGESNDESNDSDGSDGLQVYANQPTTAHTSLTAALGATALGASVLTTMPATWSFAPNANATNTYGGGNTLTALRTSAPATPQTPLKQTSRIALQSSSLINLASFCPELKVLNLANCPVLDDTLIKETGEYLSSIQHIPQDYLTRVPVSADDGVAAIVKGCKGLQSLDLRGCEWVTDATVQMVLDDCRELRALNLARCSKVKAAWRKFFWVGDPARLASTVAESTE